MPNRRTQERNLYYYYILHYPFISHKIFSCTLPPFPPKRNVFPAGEGYRYMYANTALFICHQDNLIASQYRIVYHNNIVQPSWIQVLFILHLCSSNHRAAKVACFSCNVFLDNLIQMRTSVLNWTITKGLKRKADWVLLVCISAGS